MSKPYKAVAESTFKLIHSCGAVATIVYTAETDYYYDGEEEQPYDLHTVVLQCDSCESFAYKPVTR